MHTETKVPISMCWKNSSSPSLFSLPSGSFQTICILSVIQHLVAQCPYMVSWHHVKWHHDWKCISALKQDAWMNIKVDKLEQEAIQHVTPSPCVYWIPYSSWVCYFDKMWLVKQFKSQIWTYVTSPKQGSWVLTAQETISTTNMAECGLGGGPGNGIQIGSFGLETMGIETLVWP